MCDDLVVIRQVEVPGGGGMVDILGVCPRCGGSRFWQNGKYKVKERKKQSYECKACRRQSNLDPDNRTIPAVVREIIDKLLVDGVKMAVIHRATGVSRSWLYGRHKKLTAREQS